MIRKHITKRSGSRFSLAAGMLCASLLACGITHAAAGIDSPANQALFSNNHMGNVKTGERLVYNFVQEGAYGDAFKDAITLTMGKNQEGKREATINYLSGERHRWVPPFSEPNGNPILVLFLQSDVNRMADLNGGNFRHFQKYIRLALEDGKELETVEFDYAGSKHSGKRISIQPFLNDPDKAKFKEQAFVSKQYEFIVSNDIPGGIYKIAAIVPAAEDSTKALSKTELQLHEQ